MMTFTLPAGSVDVHAHVLDPALTAVADAAYPLSLATAADYDEHLDQLGAEHGVLVTASAHGRDNRPLLAALASSGKTLRGVAVLGEEVTEDELGFLHDRGVRGVRLQDRFPGGTAPAALGELGRAVQRWGWHIEIWTDFSEHLDWLPRAIADCPVPVVLDHFGFLPAGIADHHKAIREMIRLAREYGTWVTASGAYRLAPRQSPPEADRLLLSRVQLLAEKIPDRLLWGSDWPYVAAPGERPVTGDLHAGLALWFPDQQIREQVLVANPRECYGFL
jgi:2-pyrone-4,6-dicarboxylate lactonase